MFHREGKNILTAALARSRSRRLAMAWRIVGRCHRQISSPSFADIIGLSAQAPLSLPLCFFPSRTLENGECLKDWLISRIHSPMIFLASLPSPKPPSVDGENVCWSTLWSSILSGLCRRRIRYANSEWPWPWSGGWELHRKVEGKLDSFLLARFPKCHSGSWKGFSQTIRPDG